MRLMFRLAERPAFSRGEHKLFLLVFHSHAVLGLLS